MHSQAAGDRAAEDSTTADEAATADELPALLDGSSDEGEPVSGVRLDASPGKPDFFVPLIVIDEFPCAPSSAPQCPHTFPPRAATPVGTRALPARRR